MTLRRQQPMDEPNLTPETLELIKKNQLLIEKNLKKWIDSELRINRRQETLKDRQEKFRLSVREYVPKYGLEMCKQFYEYWSQKNVNGTKMLFEMQKVFDLPRRLTIWKRKENNFLPAAKKTIPEPVMVASNPSRYHGR